MEDNILVAPPNIEDKQVLKRFLDDLVANLNNNPLIRKSGNPQTLANEIAAISAIADTDPSFEKAVAKLAALQAEIKAYVAQNLETVILQSAGDVAVVAEQFGTFYDQSLAAAWYGLTVKAGGVISGFTVGAIDRDTTTPGTEGSFFAINADIFSVAKAVEDITDPAELAYLQANNLPYGTMFNADTGSIIPAFLIDWTGSRYDIYFNGRVQFVNINGGQQVLDDLSLVLGKAADLEAARDGNIVIYYQLLFDPPITTANYGDYWLITDSWDGTYYQVVRWQKEDGSSGLQADMGWWTVTGDTARALSNAYRADVLAGTAQATADGKVTTFYQGVAPTAEGHGDIWIDTNNNNRMYLWDEALGMWVLAQDTTVAENIYVPGTTTIDGGILATDTAWIGGQVLSANPVYAWGTIPTGFALFSNGDPHSGKSYNIVGGKIYGGSITSPQFEYLTSSGHPTFGSYAVPDMHMFTLNDAYYFPYSGNACIVTMHTGIYPYNYGLTSDSSIFRLSGLNGNIKFDRFVSPTEDTSSPMGDAYQVLMLEEATETVDKHRVTVTVRDGTNTVGSYTRTVSRGDLANYSVSTFTTIIYGVKIRLTTRDIDIGTGTILRSYINLVNNESTISLTNGEFTIEAKIERLDSSATLITGYSTPAHTFVHCVNPYSSTNPLTINPLYWQQGYLRVPGLGDRLNYFG